MKYAIAIWLFGVALMIFLMVIDCNFTIKEKIEFILWLGFFLALIIAAAILFTGV